MRTQLIRIGNPAIGLVYVAYLLLLITFFYGVAYSNTYLSLVAIGSITIGIVGQKFTDLSRTLKIDNRPIARSLPLVIKWFAIQLGAFAFADAFVPHYFSVQFFGFPLASALGGVGLQNFLTVGLVFTEAEAITEELLYRGGLANVVIKGTRSPEAAFISVGFLFAVSHIPAYGFNLPVLIILGTAGTVFTVGDFQSQEILTSMLSHMLNNLLAFFATASALSGGNLLLLVPTTGIGVVELGASLSFLPVILFASKRLDASRLNTSPVR